MSYTETVIGTVVREVVFESRVITVPAGSPAPTPAAGYQIDGPVETAAGLDIYIENRVYEREAPGT